ncbi:hypothetical protein DFH11DRAFT_1576139 [Phellopilus nigrolimitatus]|nr:hypothetical protein DFH11DRAFT_1576139 [Phellopilus nigrolimitatus]
MFRSPSLSSYHRSCRRKHKKTKETLPNTDGTPWTRAVVDRRALDALAINVDDLTVAESNGADKFQTYLHWCIAFVGGFKHGPVNTDGAHGYHPSSTSLAFPAPSHLPAPPAPTMAMPTPDYTPSRTMRHALNQYADGTATPNRLSPYASPPHLPPRSHSDEPRASSSVSLSPNNEPQLMVSTRTRLRASSSPPSSPSSRKSGDKRTQCSGMTKKGEQCSRQVKTDPPLNVVDPDIPTERFCFQHRKEVMEPTGNKQWVLFCDWIPAYLHPDTQAALRVEMEKPQSAHDEPGYIYTFEIRDPKTPSEIHLKVGRAKNLVKRIDEWGKHLRGWWPGTVDEGETSLMKGRVKPGEKGAWCHRLERLVHLELADLVVHAPYLNKNFPNTPPPGSPDESSAPGTPTKAARRAPGSPARLRKGGKPCSDCGAVHKEIFSFTRPVKGKYKGEEWELIVKPVIEKWGGFVNAFV